MIHTLYQINIGFAWTFVSALLGNNIIIVFETVFGYKI